jgi:hypothetical protein
MSPTIVTVLLWALSIPPGTADPVQASSLSPSVPRMQDEVLGIPAFAQPGLRSGEECPQGSICGQDPGDCGSTTWYFYSDLMFCNPSPTTCRPARCDNFPPPGVTIDQPIGLVSWTGIYISDPIPDGCSKPENLFRVRFYSGAAPDPNNAVASEEHDATAIDTGRTILFAGATIPATIWRFIFVLDNPVNLTSGWFAVSGDGAPGCYFLWEGSGEGDNSFYEWYETSPASTYRHQTDLCDLSYCLGTYSPGAACCDECNVQCYDNASEEFCAAIGGRFVPDATCSSLSPPCGLDLGACCHDDGSCELVACSECRPAPCVGDLNCDGTIGFGDINPFVLYLSNQGLWHNTYPNCPPANGDINCDGTFGQNSFADINPFVDVMRQCGMGCPCPGPGCSPAGRAQGTYWAGPDTTCAEDCCTIVVPPGARLEGEIGDCTTPDVFNGGCNSTPPMFTLIQPGWTIYGESGTFGGYRDTDWYQTTTSAPTSFTVTVEAEFDVTVSAARAGPDPNNPCDGYRDIATPVGPPADGHNKCTPVVLTTRCLPAGTYWFIVAPADFSGVACYADYKITLVTGGTCEVQNTCGNCPDGGYVEGTAAGYPGYCWDDPSIPDPNAGCNAYPPAFEALPEAGPEPFTFCGKLWATGGFRDLDWYEFNVPARMQLHWNVTTEVPCLASVLFSAAGGDDLAPPADCSQFSWWPEALYAPCVTGTWDGAAYYAPGSYWFLVVPQDADGWVFYGYPCPMGAVDLGNDYQITLTGVPPP